MTQAAWKPDIYCLFENQRYAYVHRIALFLTPILLGYSAAICVTCYLAGINVQNLMLESYMFRQDHKQI